MNKGDSLKVLDHGYVKLIDWMGSDEAIVDAARMSTGKGFVSWEPYPGRPDGDVGFLEFLLKNNHTTPFEMCELVIEVQAPIFVFREWHRHRTQSYNELSARYTQMPNLHYLPDASRIVKQSKSNKQASGTEPIGDDKWVEDIIGNFLDEQEGIYESYSELVQEGLAKEIARINTPVSRYSRMRAKANLLNWLKFLNLRMRPDAQWEIRQYADRVAHIIKWQFPRTYALFNEWWLGATTFGRAEMEVLKDYCFIPNGPDYTMLKNRAKDLGMDDKHIEAFIAKLRR